MVPVITKRENKKRGEDGLELPGVIRFMEGMLGSRCVNGALIGVFRGCVKWRRGVQRV